MSRLITVVSLVVLCGQLLASELVLRQSGIRKMLYDRRVPIVQRLLPDDEKVWVYREVSSPPLIPVAAMTESYEEEIENLRYEEIIAVLRVAGVQSELVEEGTWIRTRVVGHIEQVVHKSIDKPLDTAVEFTLAGGSIRVGKVDVSAGSIPQLVQGQRYLVFLVTRPRLMLSALPFPVNAKDIIEPVKMNNDVEISRQSNLVGRSVPDVTKALRRR